MIMRLYEFESSMGWDFYDIPSLIVITIIFAIACVHGYKHYKRSKQAEEE